MDPAPFLRGAAFAGTPKVPYPRANPDDLARLPLDTWAQAQIPAGVRLEFISDVPDVTVAYETRTDRLGFRGAGGGVTFQLWRDGSLVSEASAVLGKSAVTLQCGETTGTAIVYLPEVMKPVITGIEGDIAPVPPQPRWIAYGDSIAEGWSASAPALGWCAIAAREQGLDLVNMGYAGAARGEIVSAEHVASLRADVISISHGTNCWNRVPHSVAQMRANTEAFLDVVRQGHPQTPILVCSPVLRPEAETTPNRLGATLSDLRDAMEHVAQSRSDVYLVEGLPIIDSSMLADPTHPNDAGHRAIAGALGPVIAKLAGES